MVPCDQRDTDKDGVNDCTDGCPGDANKLEPGACGCGKTDDFDHDGALDCVESCPTDPLKTAPGVCGCGHDDAAGCDRFTVVRVGDGTAALSVSSTAAFLEERRLDDGSLLNTTPLPTAASGANKPLTLAGSAYVEGNLKRTADGHFLTIAGYAAGTGVSNVAQSSSTTYNRVIARIAADHSIDTTTTLSTAFSGTSNNNANIRAAVSYDGSAFWAAGTSPTSNNSGGIWYVPFGATAGTQITGQSGNNPLNVRTIAIFNGQLYGATNASSFYGIFAVGAGLPTVQSTATLLPGFPSSGSSAPVDFAILDRDASIAGVDTIYLADDRSGTGNGIQKWTFNGTTWTLAYTLNTGAVRHLLAFETADSVLLLAVTAPSSGSNAIIKIVDTGSSAVAATLASATTNTAFRGVALSPVP
jgi:hypothetical protein